MSTRALIVCVALMFGVRLFVEPLAAEVIGCAGAVLAAMSFSPGDPPRGPWLLRALGVGLILAAHALQRLELGSAGIIVGIIIVANVIGVAAVLGFLRIVRASGLTPSLSRGEALCGVGLVGAVLGLVGWILVTLAASPGVCAEPLRAAMIAVSTLADAAVFVISALLLRRVLALRGGLVAQPYFLLALDGLFFLLADLAQAGVLVALVDTAALFSAIGASFGAAAGFSQAVLVRRSLLRAPGPV